ncbi:MAG TPA: sterol-binding protein [Burkholderiales bacterium]|nr:sterol-binding protein [Burkholderiales bacterium]
MLSLPFIAAINHVLSTESWARQMLAPHAGKSARLSIPPFDVDIAVLPGGTIGTSKETPETSIRANPSSLVRTLNGELADVDIRGDIEFAKTLNALFRNLRWDFEADLGKFTGDLVAHRLAQAARSFFSWQKEAAWNLGANLAEYWTEEDPLLARSDDVSGFLSEVDRLKDDAARLEKRMEKLSSRDAID